ncbi:hypothetical protein EG329_012115 [Mollisiaceae sp. DMI_Dod_QoI]|nr:hypothetical protein EG329_012115 [Helotiales sp. DMI_Dod_QoI]
MAAPPQFLPNLAPPQVPPGWRADWSAEHNTWYYVNLTTQASQWNFPVEQVQAPYGTPLPQQNPPYVHQQPVAPQASVGPEQEGVVAQDGERGLGKITAGGLLGVAGGLLAGAIFKHEKDEHKVPSPQFSFWNYNNNDDNQQSGGATSWFSKFSSGVGSQPDFTKPAETATAGAAGGGLFGSIASHIPHMPGQNAAPPPNQYAAPQHHAPTYNTGPSPPLHIVCAAYSDQDVTHIVRRMVTPGQSIDFDGDTFAVHFGDPWPGNRKQFSVIYAYGQRPWELAACSDNCGKWSLIPHQPLDKTRMEFIQNPNCRIVALVWGTGNGIEGGKGPVEKLKEIEMTGEFQATNQWMGFDGMCGPSKTAITYYRTERGEIKIATAREGGTVRLPWNPLAKWN